MHILAMFIMSSFFSFKVVDTVTDGKEEDAAAMALHSSSSDSAALLVLIRRGLHQRRHQPIDCREYHNLMIFVHIKHRDSPFACPTNIQILQCIQNMPLKERKQINRAVTNFIKKERILLIFLRIKMPGREATREIGRNQHLPQSPQNITRSVLHRGGANACCLSTALSKFVLLLLLHMTWTTI